MVLSRICSYRVCPRNCLLLTHDFVSRALSGESYDRGREGSLDVAVRVAKNFRDVIGRLSQSRFLVLSVRLVPVTSGLELSSVKVIAVSVPENEKQHNRLELG